MTTAGWAPTPAATTVKHHELGSHAAWYLAAGVVTTAIQSALFLWLQPGLGAQPANLLAIALTTVGNTEFHRRVTFADRESNAAKRHLQDFLTFAFYAGYNSIVLVFVDALVSNPSALLETTVLLFASFLGGVARFAALRWWVFARA